MGDALRAWAPAALAWVLVIHLGRGGDGPRRRVRWVLTGLAVSLTAQVPLVYAALGALTGWPHAARLVSHAGMVLTVWAAQEFMAALNGRDHGRRWQAWWAAGAFAAMCGLFVTLPRDLLPQSPRVMEYVLVYGAAQLPALFTVIVLGVRYARQARDEIIRASLQLVVAGTGLAVLYLVNKSVLAMSSRLDFSFAIGRSVTLSRTLPTTAYVLVLAGAALPASLGWWHRYRLFRRLGPLWWALYRADPAIALDRPTLPDLLIIRGLRHRLYRRVIEIRDGLLTLHPYRDPEVAAAARAGAAGSGRDGRAVEALAEAASIAAALDARAAGAEPGPAAPEVSGGADLAADTAYLGEVSAAFRARVRGGRGVRVHRPADRVEGAVPAAAVDVGRLREDRVRPRPGVRRGAGTGGG